MRMLGHMTRRYDLALRVDHLPQFAADQVSNGGDTSISNADVGVEGGAAGAIDNSSTADNRVEDRHCSSLIFRGRFRPFDGLMNRSFNNRAAQLAPSKILSSCTGKYAVLIGLSIQRCLR